MCEIGTSGRPVYQMKASREQALVRDDGEGEGDSKELKNLQNFFRSYRYVLLDLKGHRDVTLIIKLQVWS